MANPCWCNNTDYHPIVGGHGRASVGVMAVWENGYRYLLTAREAHSLAAYFERGETTDDATLALLQRQSFGAEAA